MTAPPTQLATDRFLTSPRGQQLLELLRAGVAHDRIVAIGRYRRSWTPREVVWARRYYIEAATDLDQWVPTGYDPEPRHSPPGQVELTPRTAEALDGLCRGLTTAQIAAELGVVTNTAEQYVRAAIRAVGAASRDEAVRRAQSGQVRLFLLERGGGTRVAS